MINIPLGRYQNGYLLLLRPETEGYFSSFLQHKNWVGWLKVKSRNCEPSPLFLGSKEVLTLKLVPTQPPPICPYGVRVQWLLLCVTWCRHWYLVFVFACLSRFRGGSLPCDINPLLDIRKIIDFHLVHVFPCCEDRKETSKFFECQSWNQKLEMLSLNSLWLFCIQMLTSFLDSFYIL